MCVFSCLNIDRPLFVAAEFGHADVVELLLAHGADAERARKDNGATPLYVARHRSAALLATKPRS